VGHATLGRIGFEGRYDYGALGSVTNIAARLSSEAAGGQILLSQRAYAALEGRVEARRFGQLVLKGLARPVEAYELVGLAS
jgi:class 3 adenylate cyclase